MSEKQENSNVPVLPEGGHYDLSQYRLSAAQCYEEPHNLLQYHGVPFGSLGDIQAVSGHKKNGKTFLVTQLIAAILGTGSERMGAKLPGLELNEATVKWLGHEPTVLYIDTEMAPLYTAKVLRRVHWLCGWPLTEDNPRFQVLRLRQVAENGERQKIVLDAIDQMKPTAVFIDGIRDIVNDFNDNKEAATLVGTLMAKATELNCCVWNCLHFNPRPGDDSDGKMRGHLGTELGNKVSDTFSCSKKKTAQGVIFTVSQQDARGKDVDDWCFEVTDDAGALGIPRMCNAPAELKQTAEEKKLTDTEEALRQILTNGRSMKWGDLTRAVSEYFAISDKTANRRLCAARDAGIIKKLDSDYKWFLGSASTIAKECKHDSGNVQALSENSATAELPFEPSNNEPAAF